MVSVLRGKGMERPARLRIDEMALESWLPHSQVRSVSPKELVRSMV